MTAASTGDTAASEIGEGEAARCDEVGERREDADEEIAANAGAQAGHAFAAEFEEGAALGAGVEALNDPAPVAPWCPRRRSSLWPPMRRLPMKQVRTVKF